MKSVLKGVIIGLIVIAGAALVISVGGGRILARVAVVAVLRTVIAAIRGR
jgi:hypothetical protein